MTSITGIHHSKILTLFKKPTVNGTSCGHQLERPSIPKHKRVARKLENVSQSALDNGTVQNGATTCQTLDQILQENSCWILSLTNSILVVLGIVLIAFSVRDLFIFKIPGIQLEEMYKDERVALIPTWSEADKDTAGQDWMKLFYNVIIIMGFLFTTTGILGIGVIVQQYRMSTQFFCLYAVFLVLAMVGQIFGVMFVYYGDSRMHKETKHKLQQQLIHSYLPMSEDRFSVSLNLLMVNGECCGIAGADDFSTMNLTFHLEGHTHFRFAPRDLYWPRTPLGRVPVEVPPACCKRSVFNADTDEDRFDQVLECARSDSNGTLRNVDGCFNKYHDNLKEKYGRWIMIATAFLVPLESISLFLVLYWTQGIEEEAVDEDYYYYDDWVEEEQPSKRSSSRGVSV